METSPQVTASLTNACLHITIGGHWDMNHPWPQDAHAVLDELNRPQLRKVILADTDLAAWDSSLLIFLVQIITAAKAKNLPVQQHLPSGVERMLKLAFAVPPREGSRHGKPEKLNFIAQTGKQVLALLPDMSAMLNFLGACVMAVGKFCSGRANMRSQDLFAAMHQCGGQALPIISLTSMLFGLILAFVGAVQLTQFGAQIYVAGLVGIGMLRVMGAVMVGVVMAGRVGAAYAALIGTMQVNEEVDALSTLGISPIEFLVLPRIIALTLMIPLLTLYADIMGVLGGFLVGITMLQLNPMEYINATIKMVPFIHILIGLAYGIVFGIIIAVTGCYQGMRCGRSAQAVGQATTAAVVQAIVGIIVATAIITVICNVLGV